MFGPLSSRHSCEHTAGNLLMDLFFLTQMGNTISWGNWQSKETGSGWSNPRLHQEEWGSELGRGHLVTDLQGHPEKEMDLPRQRTGRVRQKWTVLGIRGPGFSWWHSYLQVWTWASHWTPLGTMFLISGKGGWEGDLPCLFQKLWWGHTWNHLCQGCVSHRTLCAKVSMVISEFLGAKFMTRKYRDLWHASIQHAWVSTKKQQNMDTISGSREKSKSLVCSACSAGVWREDGCMGWKTRGKDVPVKRVWRLWH